MSLKAIYICIGLASFIVWIIFVGTVDASMIKKYGFWKGRFWFLTGLPLEASDKKLIKFGLPFLIIGMIFLIFGTFSV